MSALVSFERVFEVLDLHAADRRAGRRPRRCPTGRSRWSSTTCASATRRPTRCRSPRWRRWRRLDTRGGVRGAARRLVPRRAGPDGRAGRLVGRGQVDDRPAAAPALRRRRGRGAARRRRRPRPRVRLDPRRRSGMVTQDGHLFHESIRGQPAARPARTPTEDELWDALRRARLDDLVASLPDGLDTVVGERGYRLSGGERQRLTIARLLLARPRVVILDEATAHLDSTSEAAVQEALGEALAGRTAMVIAHRLSTDPGRRPDPGRRGRPDRRARHATSSCSPRRPLRGAVPHPVRRGGLERGLRRSGPSPPSCPRPCPWRGAVPSPRRVANVEVISIRVPPPSRSARVTATTVTGMSGFGRPSPSAKPSSNSRRFGGATALTRHQPACLSPSGLVMK